jgi:sugar/nucleoside kinase (ribokinase family)
MKGLFVGLTTLDFLYLVEQVPRPNQKIVAQQQSLSAGGPATNAAVTFAHCGHQAQLLSALGCHPLVPLIHSDLQTWGVEHRDLNPHHDQVPPVSSIMVTRSSGDRAVVSINATQATVASPLLKDLELTSLLQGVDIILIDGHQIPLGQAIAVAAQKQNIPVVLDGGSWKPGLETLLPWVTYALCSADFHPPQCHGTQEVFEFLRKYAIPYCAITQGPDPILYQTAQQAGAIPLTPVKVQDTLGAGDIFHGAFCHFILRTDFSQALSQAGHIASFACQFFGTRQWLWAFRQQQL